MSRARPELGRWGEDAALAVYIKAGFRQVARNWRCSIGELDLVVQKADVLVVCEVKTRSGDAGFGDGYESVTWAKRRRLRRLTQAFLAGSRISPRVVRFDVASVSVAASGAADVQVFQDAFSAD
jgi:putative endonuclease